MRLFGTAILGMLLFHPQARAEDLVEMVKSGNAASLASLVTFYCRFEQRSQPNAAALGELKLSIAPHTMRGEFWRSGDFMRIKEAEGPFGPRVMVGDLARREGTLQMRANANRAVIASADELETTVDVWDQALCYIASPQITLSRAFEMQARVNSSRRTVLDGRQLIYVDLSLTLQARRQRLRCKLWIDPLTNYLIRKLTTTIILDEGPESANDSEVKSFQEVRPGIYFPTEIERRVLGNGVELNRWITRLTDIRINRKLPEGIFDRTLPRGTIVADRLNGRAYRVGGHGEPERQGRLVDPADEPISGTATPPDADRSEFPWARLALITFCIIGVVSGVLLIRRRARGMA